jgi:hypothetical protein
VVPSRGICSFLSFYPFFSLSLAAFPCFPFIALDVARKLFPPRNSRQESPRVFFWVAFSSFLTISPTPFEGRKIHVSRAIDSPFEILEKNMCIEWGLCCNSLTKKTRRWWRPRCWIEREKCVGWRWTFLPKTREK